MTEENKTPVKTIDEIKEEVFQKALELKIENKDNKEYTEDFCAIKAMLLLGYFLHENRLNIKDSVKRELMSMEREWKNIERKKKNDYIQTVVKEGNLHFLENDDMPEDTNEIIKEWEKGLKGEIESSVWQEKYNR